MSAADAQALQSLGGTHAEVRAALVQSTTHAPAKPAPVSAQPEDSVIVNRGPAPAELSPAPRTPYGPAVTGAPALVAPVAAIVAPAAPPVAAQVAAPVPAIPAAAPVVAAPVAPPAAFPPAPVAAPPGPAPDRLALTRIVKRPVVAVPRAPESTGSFDAKATFGRKSKAPLWIGLGAGVLVLGALGVWATSSGGGDPAPQAAPATIAKTVAAPTHDIPPPAPEPTPAPAPTPEPKTVPISALAQVPMPVGAAAAPAPQPVRPPPPTVALQSLPPAPAPRPAPAPAPAPRPAAAARPRSGTGGGTIVHDVPF